MFPAFDVSTSALVAQRMRLNAISSNLANIATTRNEYGEPEAYSPRYVTFQADADLTTSAGGMGVKVASVDESNAPPLMKFEPGHPDANADGYVAYPNVDMTTEIGTLSTPLPRFIDLIAPTSIPSDAATRTFAAVGFRTIAMPMESTTCPRIPPTMPNLATDRLMSVSRLSPSATVIRPSCASAPRV